jgi:hypothetical protein
MLARLTSCRDGHRISRIFVMNDPTRDNSTTDAEEALFQRLLRRLGEANQGAVDGAGTAAFAAVDVAGSAVANVGYAAGAVGKVAGGAVFVVRALFHWVGEVIVAAAWWYRTLRARI